MPLRRRIEQGFEAFGRAMVRRRWWVIAACLAFSAVFLVRLPDLRVDNSDQAFLLEGDPERIRYDRFKEQFDREDRVAVALRPPAVFDLAFLERLRALHRAIEDEVPYVEEVTSLVNARHTRGVGDELVVEDLMEDWPEDEADLARLRERALANPLYRDRLIGREGDLVVVSIKPYTWSTLGPQGALLGGFEETEPGEGAMPTSLTDAEGAALVAKLFEVLEAHPFPDTERHVVGGPTMDVALNQAMQHDVSTLIVLSQLVCIVLLFVLFGRISAVLLPMTVVMLSMLSTLGFMPWLDVPFSVTLNMLPAFLIVVGTCDSVHILAIVYRRLAAGASREDAIAGALAHSGLAVVMTSVTTAAGLLSFVFAELAPIAQLGVLAPAGVLLAMVYSLTLLPALLAVSPLRARPRRRGVSDRGVVDRVLARVGDWSTRHPARVLGGTALLLALALPGFLRVHFAHDGILWLPEHDPLRRAFFFLDRELRGLSSLELLVHTGEENGLYEPAVLRRIERAMRLSEAHSVGGRPVNQATSIVDLVKEIHQALHEGRADARVLPDTRELIAQELLLFENSGSDDVEDVADTRLSTARVTIQTPWVDTLEYPPFIAAIRADLREVLGELDFELTGGSVLFTTIFEGVIYSMARSYAFAIGVITILMLLLIGNPRRGLVAMVPNLIPIYLVLAVMGFADIPLDASTLLIGGIVIGLAVDDTIHFMHKFARYYEESGDARRAVRDTLLSTGTALFFTSAVLGAGYLVFLAAYMNNIVWFGLLAFTGTVTAFVADVVLGPALMVLVTRAESREAALAPAGP